MTDRGSCAKCSSPLSQPARGRPKRYCSTACRRAAEFELRRVQKALTTAENEAEAARRTVETRDAGLAGYGGALTPGRECLALEQASRRVVELEERMRVLLSEGEDDGG